MLTLNEGWKPIDKITKNDQVATLVNGDTLKYEQPKNIFKYDYDGDVMQCDNKKIGFVSTMEHKHYVKLAPRIADGIKNHIEGGSKRDYMLCTANDLQDVKEMRFKKDCDKLDFNEHKTITIDSVTKSYRGVITTFPQLILPMDDWIQFFGLYITEGCIDQSNMIRIRMDKARVKTVLDDICPRLGLTINKYGTENCYYFTNHQMAHYLMNFGTSTQKYLPQWCFELNIRQSRLLLNSLICGDGCNAKGNSSKNDSWEFYTGSYDLAQDVQQLVIHSGWTYSCGVKHTAGEELAIKGVKTKRSTDQYRILLTKSTGALMPNVKKDDIKIIKYKGAVHCIEVSSHIFMVRQSSQKSTKSGFWTGNSGQKGVCGIQLLQSDMPFTKDGLIPDIIMNPHSYPKRMTIGQIYESGLGNICAERGATCDGTVFRKLEMDDMIAECRRLGLEEFGRQRLYCGLTGAWMDAMIFVGPVYYQRLHKFVAKSIYSIDIGPTDIITRQPLDGKANQGGLRISELQRDVLLSHGAARFFSEKMFDDSDDFDVYRCRCGSWGIVNPDMDIYKCNMCGDNADIHVTKSCWASKTLLMELNAMNIGTRVMLEPYTFYI